MLTRCRKCSAKIKCPSKLVGTEIACPRCRGRFVVADESKEEPLLDEVEEIPFAEPSKKLDRPKILIKGFVIAILAIGITAIALCGLMIVVTLLKPEPVHERGMVSATLEAEEFCQLSLNNPAAMMKYNSQWVQINGRFGSSGKNWSRHYFLFSAGFFGHASPECYLDDVREVQELRRGDQIEVEGLVVADGGRVSVVHCRVKKK